MTHSCNVWRHNHSRLSLHRRQTEDVGLRRGSRCVCAPGVCSVYGLFSMVSDSKMTVSAQVHHLPHPHPHPYSSVLTHSVVFYFSRPLLPLLIFPPASRAAVTAPCAALGPRSTLPAVRRCGWAATLTSSPLPTLNTSSPSPAMVRARNP